MSFGIERWKGKVALVTGATSGIGRAIAVKFSRLGIRVAITGRRVERLNALKKSLEQDGGAVLALEGDQRKEDTNRGFFRKIRDSWGGLDILVNNAGVSGGHGFAKVDWATIESCLDLNVRAVGLCMQEALQDMEGKEDAAIINISSMNAHRVVAGRSSVTYSASKHTLRVLTDGLRGELASRKSTIKVAMISPGLVRTEWHDRAPHEYEYRPLEPEDIADVAVNILSAPRHVQVCDVLVRSVEQVV